MAIRNVLFIMADQWRADHFGAAGHPFLKTPHIDALAARGVLFRNAYVQSGVCGPSRMSFYTGRYAASHGATWNRAPLSIAELTLGDYLRAAGRSLVLSGKTHMMPDVHGLARVGLSGTEGNQELARLIRSGGFVEMDRHDGHHGEPGSRYANWLRAQGYASQDPWTDYVISAVDDDGKIVSGWNMRNARLPARVREEHSETAYTTDRTIDFIRQQGETPWTMHLSYVKPHWPYMAPAPYNALYGPDQVTPALKCAEELENAHPVVAAYREHEESQHFARDETWRTVRPTYQGLIGQLDAHLGRLWQVLEETGRWRDTLVILTADHGDLLGDHWLGEKELFYDPVIKVPMVVHDPSDAANGTRGHADDRFVEAIDVVPTILDGLGLPAQRHRIEGRSLLRLTRGTLDAEAGEWRDAVFCELDYAFRKARQLLGRRPDECYAWMVRTARWKYIEWQGMRPQLFDLDSDPSEFRDLGAEPGLESVRRAMRDRLTDWFSRHKKRTTVTLQEVEERTASHERAGVFFGKW
jgi:arylsulfatase A-like enzyme